MSESDLILKIIEVGTVDEDDLSNHLHDICDRVHSSCDWECPVYRMNGLSVPVGLAGGCRVFKSGHEMLEFLRTELARGRRES